MGENSKISWTGHTFNGLRGCAKVENEEPDLSDSGCKHCYAESMSHRNPRLLGVWGEEGTRVLASENMWKEPLRWNREAETAGARARVFSYSLGDVFERPMNPENMAVCDAARARLFPLIEATPWLDWQLLTKRAHEIMEMVPAHWRNGFPDNVWMGVSVENQSAAEKRIADLMKVPARVRWLSCEPMIGPIDILGALARVPDLIAGTLISKLLQWVVCGGESGGGRRPFDHAWAQSLRDQCGSAGIPFFMKQDSAFHPGTQGTLPDALWNTKQFPQ